MSVVKQSAPAAGDKHHETQKNWSRGRLKGQNRLRLVVFCFALCFAVISGRLVELSVVRGVFGDKSPRPEHQARLPRPDIVDRNGMLLAADIKVYSLFANPRKIIDVDEAVELLTAVLPDLNVKKLYRDLSNKKRAFVWIKREISPSKRAEVHDQGIPGVGFRKETLRIYPNGNLASHVLGYVDVDSHGIAGMEKFLDDQGALYTASLADPARRAALPAHLALDGRVQHAMSDEIAKAVKHFKAKAGAGVLMDIYTGEIVAMVSLPDYNPNEPKSAQQPEAINRVTTGVYELGSVIKAITFAMALETGAMTMNSKFDARQPLKVGRSRIHDFHAQRRILSVEDVFLHSSNIGTARMALAVGLKGHQDFLRKAGFFDRMVTELPEGAAPILPKRWGKITTVTAAFGHGFAIQPLQGLAATAALLNGGKLIPPTFLKRGKEAADGLAVRLVSKDTSEKMKYLFRLNAEKGTARKADKLAAGYRIGGKTGTAEKVIKGRYSKNHRLNSFVGGFPMEDPKYAILIMLDEPKPVEGTYGYATSGWNAVPTAGKVVARIAPLLGVAPKLADVERAKKPKKKVH